MDYGTKDGDTASWHLVHFVRRLPKLTPEESRNVIAQPQDSPRDPSTNRREKSLKDGARNRRRTGTPTTLRATLMTGDSQRGANRERPACRQLVVLFAGASQRDDAAASSEVPLQSSSELGRWPCPCSSKHSKPPCACTTYWLGQGCERGRRLHQGQRAVGCWSYCPRRSVVVGAGSEMCWWSPGGPDAVREFASGRPWNARVTWRFARVDHFDRCLRSPDGFGLTTWAGTGAVVLG